MLNWIKQILGLGPAPDWATLVQKGATIVDVRTPGEFAGGHIKGAVNIPLNTLSQKMGKLKKDKPVITCCASGARSSAALDMLRSAGFQEVYNGGGWMSLRNKL
ncbi:MAG: rhodanese-like domain-containing protein [Bacteroidia bacterium]|nr:rhodanese-like domain-containing protein [Bacteroidia bacterium]